MRLGGPIFKPWTTPNEWAAAVLAAGYRAAYCPLGADADADACRAFEQAAAAAGIVIAEVGAWSNPLAADDGERAAALAKCQAGLALADAVGARCCVNIAGGRGPQWDGPHPDNLSSDTFERIVESVRDIIDTVQPLRAYYTLETMPWIPPHSAESYEQLLRAIDRPRFAVHFDPVNLINSPERIFANGAVIRDFVARLGPHIQSCHAKDITLSGRLTVHLDECRPGTGALDYDAYLGAVATLRGDLPVMLEHLPSAEEYALAADHLRAVAARIGVRLDGFAEIPRQGP